MFIDATLATSIAGGFAAIGGGVGWLVIRLFLDRAEALKGKDQATDRYVEMLRLQFADTAGRKELWDKLTHSVVDNGRTIDSLKSTFIESARALERFSSELAALRDEVRRLK